MQKDKNMFQRKEYENTSEKHLNEMGVTDLPNKEFKVMVINMLIGLRRKMDKHSQNFNKELESTRKYETVVTDLKSTITEMKNILEKFKNRLDEEERISELRHRAVEFNQSE